MNQIIKFLEPADVQDLQGFLARAKKLDNAGLVRIKSYGNVLAVSVSPIFETSLLGTGPTIIGMRTLQVANELEIDASFEISAMLDRLASPLVQITLRLELPSVTKREAWTGISAPLDGWEYLQDISSVDVVNVAEAGIEEVGNALGKSIGVSIASKVRAEVWGRPASFAPMVSGGACFGLYGLGFISKESQVQVFRSGSWLRLTTPYGHILTKALVVKSI